VDDLDVISNFSSISVVCNISFVPGTSKYHNQQ